MKPKKSSVKEKSTFTSSFSIKDYIPEKYIIPSFLGFVFLLFVVFFYPLYFGNMTFQSGDIVTSMGFEPHTDSTSINNQNMIIATAYKIFDFVYTSMKTVRDSA